MKLSQITNILDATHVAEDMNNVEKDREDMEVETACGADLMSDVLAFSHGKTLLLTGLTNPQVIRTAEMTDIDVICFVRGKKPTDATLKLAGEKNIKLLVSSKSLFECCGLLYMNDIKPEKLQQFY
jgi:hypothetical protein